MKTVTPRFATLHVLMTLAVLVTAAPATAAPGNIITGIEVQEGPMTRVVIHGSTEPTFTVFRLGQPPRVVVDLAGANLAGVKTPAESRSAEAAVSLITTTQFKDPVHPIGRVVVGLSRDIPFDVKAEGHNVVVNLMTAREPAQPVAQSAPQPAPDAPIVVEGPPTKEPATRLLAIAAEDRPGGGAVLQLKTNGAVARYEVEEVSNPSRLVVDLYGVTKAPKRAPRLKGGPLSRVRIGKHPTHVRVVLDARREALPRFDVMSTEDGVVVAFSAAPRAAPAAVAPKAQAQAVLAKAEPAPSPARPTASQSPDPTEGPAELQDPLPEAPAAARLSRVEDVRFDEKGGFWRLKIAGRGPLNHKVSVDNPRLKVLEISQAELPRSLERSLDTTAFAGPVQAVATFRDPERPGVVKVAVDLGAGVEHKVFERDGALYWDFRSTTPAADTTTAAGPSQANQTQSRTAAYAVEAATLARQGTPAARRYTGRRITIDLKDADVLNVLRLIAEVSRLNIIASEDVKGSITIKLRNVPWDQALDIILKVKALGQEKNGNIIRVAPAAVLRAEKEARDQERAKRVELDPTVVKLLPVNYASAQEMLPQVTALLSGRGKATVDQRTNVIIVEDVKENIFQAEKLVRALDTQTPQVLIEARIVEATSNFSRTMGIQWGYGVNFSQLNGNPTGLVFPYNVGSAGGADDPQTFRSGQADPGIAGPANYAVNLPANAGGQGSTALGFNFGSIGNVVNLTLRLTAAEQEGLAKVVSAPKVATLDNKTAKISQGVDIPVARVSAQGVQTQLIASALELEVTPHITADGSVLMRLRITNNRPDFGRVVQGVPSFQKKEANTEVMVRDGETTVVGGIYTRNQEDNYQRSPFLGSLPVVGWLFKSTSTTDSRQELLAFITPHIANRQASMPGGGTLKGR